MAEDKKAQPDQQPAQPVPPAPPVQLPRETYRDLLTAKANGEEVPLHDLNIWRLEEELIRSALLHGRQYIGAGIEHKHLFAPGHRVAWKAIERIYKEYPDLEEIDDSVLLSEIRRIAPESMLGRRGQSWLSGITSETPVPVEWGLKALVKEIQQNWRCIKWKAQLEQTSERVGHSSEVAELQSAYLMTASEMQMEVASDARGGMRGLADYEWDPNATLKGSVIPMGLGLDPEDTSVVCGPVDEAAGGGHGRGEMMVIGGGTGHGKSYFAQRLCRNVARNGFRIAYISCEDPLDLFFCRNVADFSNPKVSPGAIRMRRADPDVVQVARARMKKELADRVMPLHMPKPSLSQLTKQMWSYRYAANVDLIIIDYLQAIHTDEMINNRVQEIGKITSTLKAAAHDCDVGLVCFSQYAREQYKNGAEPGLNSFKYCGDIENESELVVLLWKDADGRLHAKVPKIKWARSDEYRYIIDVDEMTGCHGKWYFDNTPPPEPESKKSKRAED